jgi:hypothetical protein
MKRLMLLLGVLMMTALACNAPQTDAPQPTNTSGPPPTLSQSWEDAFTVRQGEFDATITEVMLEEAIFRGVSQQNPDIQQEDIDIIINDDGSMQLVFVFLVPNINTDATATVDYTVAVTDAGNLNVTVQSATVSGPANLTINVPTDILAGYSDAINSALTGGAGDANVRITNLSFQQGSVTVTGQVTR